MFSRIGIVVTVGLFSMFLAGGCTSQLMAGGHSPAPTPTPGAAVVIHDADSGRMITVHAGQRLRIVLGSDQRAGSTYWTFGAVRGPQLAQVGQPRNAGRPPGAGASGCQIAGSGCGTVTLTVTAVRPGTAQIAASRTTCGEAIACPARKGHFAIQIRVLA
jgi:hypothetical protein